MKIKHLALLGAVALSVSPIAAFADLHISNNSNSPATALAGMSPCSSAAGTRGVIKAHGEISVPDFLVGMYCKKDCQAHVFMTKNCSGKSIATVVANMHDGVKSIQNSDNSPDGYRVVGSGKNVAIEGGPHRKWYRMFF